MRFNIQQAIRYKYKALLLMSVLALTGCPGILSAGVAYAADPSEPFLIPQDSIGHEVVNGQTFVLYRVEPKETLYSISNRYGLSVQELVKHNPETESGLKIGAVLRVPYNPEKAESGNFHTVDKAETLYSISRRYEVSVAELKDWNNLSSDAINLGDRLRVAPPTNLEASLKPQASMTASSDQPQSNPLDFVGKVVHTVASKETLYSIARRYDTTEEQIREWNRMTNDQLAVDQKLIVGTAKGMPGRSESGRLMRNGGEQSSSGAKEHTYNNNPITITQIGDPSQEDLAGSVTEATGSVRKMTELGMAMVIDEAAGTKKYLALHRTAPIGTIMQVHNEMNNLSVFVRVVGKLPATGDNDKVLIKLSRKAFDKLGAYNEKFPVRLTYVP
jgi:LysM repeat protein